VNYYKFSGFAVSLLVHIRKKINKSLLKLLKVKYLQTRHMPVAKNLGHRHRHKA